MLVAIEWMVMLFAPLSIAFSVIKTEPLIVKFPGMMNGTKLTL